MRTRPLPGFALTPRATSSILRRLAAERGAALVIGKSGRLSVRSLAGYERQRKRMRSAILTQKPWESRRKATRDPLWPIGSKPLGTTGTFRRVDLYADR